MSELQEMLKKQALRIAELNLLLARERARNEVLIKEKKKMTLELIRAGNEISQLRADIVYDPIKEAEGILKDGNKRQ